MADDKEGFGDTKLVSFVKVLLEAVFPGRMKEPVVEMDRVFLMAEMIARYISDHDAEQAKVITPRAERLVTMSRIGARSSGLQDAAKMLIERAENGIESQNESLRLVAASLLMAAHDLLAMSSEEMAKITTEH